MTHPLALVIEDDPKLAAIFAQALRTAEFETEVVSRGDAALERLNTVQPAVIVLDLHLPKVSGRDILHQICTAPHLSNTRVIIATADPLMAEALDDETDLVLIKPISFVQLRDLAARLRPPDTMMD